jgi:copper transport protein
MTRPPQRTDLTLKRTVGGADGYAVLSTGIAVRATALMFAVAIFVWVGASAASAHVSVVSSVPADGSVLADPPDTLEIVFDGDVYVTPGAVEVRDTDGAVHALVDVVIRGTVLTARFAHPLGDGTYTVRTRVRSAENHVVANRVAFAVASGRGRTESTHAGHPAASAAALRHHGASDHDHSGGVGRPPPLAGATVWRILEIGALALVLAGGAVSAVTVVPVLGGTGARRRRRIMLLGLSVLGAVRVMGLLVSTALSEQLPGPLHVAPVEVAAMVASGSGRLQVALVLHASGAAAAGVSAVTRRRAPMVAAGVLLIAGTALGGHSIDGTVSGLFAVAHVGAASVWIAVTVAILSAISSARRIPGALRRIARRAALVAGAAVAVLVLSGIALLSRHGISALVGTAYGARVVHKIVAVAIVLGVAAVTHRWARRGDERLGRPLSLEFVGLAVVVVLAAALAVTPRSDAALAPSLVVSEPQLGGELVLSPGAVGTNTVAYSPTEPIATSGVKFQLRSLSSPIATLTVALRPDASDPTQLVGDALVIAEPGVWNAVVMVVSEGQPTERSARLLVTSEPAA